MIEVYLPLAFRLFISKKLPVLAVESVLASFDAQNSSGVTLVFTNNWMIRKLNNKYRHIDSPTDVLSFGADETIPTNEKYLGDIVISMPRAIRQARQHHHSIKSEIILLIVHGTLHLLGYDHMDEKSKKVMWKKQEAALLNLGISITDLDI